MNITAKIDSTDVRRQHEKMVKGLIAGARKAVWGVGPIVVPKVQQHLKDKILRPRESHGRIEANITSEIEEHGGDIVVGVGNIERLNSNVPWWRIQEQGGPVSRKVVPGHFIDMSGNIVPFSEDRNTVPFSTQSDDLFVYTPYRGGWSTPGDYYASGIRPTFMYVKRPITGKWYFRDGFATSKDEVLSLFKEAFRGAFRG